MIFLKEKLKISIFKFIEENDNDKAELIVIDLTLLVMNLLWPNVKTLPKKAELINEKSKKL